MRCQWELLSTPSRLYPNLRLMHLPVPLRISGSHSLRNNSFTSSFRFLRPSRPFLRRMTSSQAAVVRSLHEAFSTKFIVFFNHFTISLVWKIPPWSSSKPSSTVLGLMQRVAKLSLLPVRILRPLRSAVLMEAFLYSLDPATNEVLGNIPEMGLNETTTAIQAASKAFVEWGKTTAKVWPPHRILSIFFNSTKSL